MSTQKYPLPPNEAVLDYAPGSPEKKQLQEALAKMAKECPEIPLYIGAEERLSKDKDNVVMPHRHSHVVAKASRATEKDVEDAILAAQEARQTWAYSSFEERAQIFLKAAELISGPRRAQMNAATILGQSKTPHQAEIDSACELIDFLRLNVHFAAQLGEMQPFSPKGMHNEIELRPLDGFVFAITPFNFTAIAGNLPTAPALMGNTVIWKPAPTQMRSAYVIMEVLKEAGLPSGVINLVSGDPNMIGNTVLASEHLAAVHFTGSTATFEHIYRTLTEYLPRYNSYPRIVGETGGKDFIVAHPTADREALTTAIVRGGYEFQGQKCSAASRLFIAESVWNDIKDRLCQQIESLKVGDPADFSTFVGAVIDEKSFDKISSYLKLANEDSSVEVLTGGKGDKSKGYFIEPTLVRTNDPNHRLMTEEIFGPVVSCYVYPDKDFEKILETCDKATKYALTGAVFARDRDAIQLASKKLRFAAGNFYINDKPTGAVVNQQPFGGSRKSGTNDKAGSLFNLLRWTSPRSIKETYAAPTDYRYPYLE